MNVSRAGLEMIIRGECGDHHPARTWLDELGRRVIGYGHPETNSERVIGRQEAYDLLEADLRQLQQGFPVSVQSIAQNQFDALVAWAWHAHNGRAQAVGQVYEQAALWAHMEARMFVLAGAEFLNWVMVNGRPHTRAIGRRQRESACWSYGHR